MDDLFEAFAQAHAIQNGYLLAQTLSPVAPPEDPRRLVRIWQSTNGHSARGDIKHFIKAQTAHRRSLDPEEVSGWVEVYFSYWKALGEILAGESGKSSWTYTYEAWRELCSMLIRGYNNSGFEAWTIPSLYLVGKYLRLFAIKSDEERSHTSFDPSAGASIMQDDFDPEMEKQAQLRDCEQHLKRIFTLCLNDRAPLEESRKWGIYFIINLLFKTYFKLNSASLSRTILKTLAVYNDKGDMPPLESFPAAQRVTFRYYEGVLLFLEENYVQAEKRLVEAWQLCHKDAKANLERILTYLVPCKLLTSHVLPTKHLLEPFPRLQRLFLPLSQCIRRGDLRAFDLALQEAENEFVRRRIYLTLERGRDIALRNLLRKVYIAGGFDDTNETDAAPVRRSRIPVAEFRAAVCMCSGGELIDNDEVECLLANMIYKDLMKGYIHRERGIVVLSKKGAFPGTGV
ncbi:hypothetical protein XA68_13521 [Ophiocordyceps unilateralis]|uniref:Protein CSN12 homolog n=1 Tax=Ophiocordyceps unilateralis TaxID=268505 RepID=A0A2A9PMJ8_OPHUN|nr:hypothetical protein XA68_13521 [Ophiocordyceps unilateralis]